MIEFTKSELEAIAGLADGYLASGGMDANLPADPMGIILVRSILNKARAGEQLMTVTRSCWAILVDEELPGGWDDLPFEQKFEANEAAQERARARWHATHPEMHHDDELWEKEIAPAGV